MELRIHQPGSETDDHLVLQALPLDRDALRASQQDPERYGHILCDLLFGGPCCAAPSVSPGRAGQNSYLKLAPSRPTRKNSNGESWIACSGVRSNLRVSVMKASQASPWAS